MKYHPPFTLISFRSTNLTSYDKLSGVLVTNKPDALDVESSALHNTPFQDILTASFGFVALDLQSARIMCHHFAILVLEANLPKRSNPFSMRRLA